MAHRKKYLAIASLFACLFMSPLAVYAQPHIGMAGIGITIATPPPYGYSDHSLNSQMEMRPDITVPVWISEKFKIEPSFGLLAYQNFTYWRLGFSGSSHFTNGNSSPYVALHANMWVLAASGDFNSTNYVFGIAGGEEYFLSPKVSIGGEVQLNHAVPDKINRIFIPRNVTYTAVSISSRFYF